MYIHKYLGADIPQSEQGSYDNRLYHICIRVSCRFSAGLSSDYSFLPPSINF